MTIMIKRISSKLYTCNYKLNNASLLVIYIEYMSFIKLKIAILSCIQKVSYKNTLQDKD